MKIRPRAELHEARQWDGDLAGFQSWLKSTCNRPVESFVERDGVRLRVKDMRFDFSLAVGDWLIASLDNCSFRKCRAVDFPSMYEIAK